MSFTCDAGDSPAVVTASLPTDCSVASASTDSVVFSVTRAQAATIADELALVLAEDCSNVDAYCAAGDRGVCSRNSNNLLVRREYAVEWDAGMRVFDEPAYKICFKPVGTNAWMPTIAKEFVPCWTGPTTVTDDFNA